MPFNADKFTRCVSFGSKDATHMNPGDERCIGFFLKISHDGTVSLYVTECESLGNIYLISNS